MASGEASKFCFVNCTDDPNVELKRLLPKVRRHVMQDHLRKRKRVGKLGGEIYLQQLRKLKPRNSNPEWKSKGRSQISSEQDASDDRPIATPVATSLQSYSLKTYTRTQNGVSLDPDPHSLQSHRFDPFETLPVNSEYIDSIAQWHFKKPFQDFRVPRQKTSSMEAILEKRVLENWRGSSMDVALFRGLICMTECKKSFLTGKRDEVKYFHYKGKTIESVNLELREPTPSKRLLLLLTFLAGLTLYDQGLEAAKVHMNIVATFLRKYPIASYFDDLEFRFIVRTDLRLAAAEDGEPMLPFYPRYTTFRCSKNLLRTAEKLTLRTLGKLPKNVIDSATFYGLFGNLHQFCLLCDIEQPSTTEMEALDGIIYWLEYHLSVVNHQLKTTRSTEFSEPFSMVIFAAQLLEWSVMKFIFHTWQSASQPKSLGYLYERLAHSKTLIHTWESQGHLSSLLWVLFVARNALRNLLSQDVPRISLSSLDSKKKAPIVQGNGTSKSTENLLSFDSCPLDLFLVGKLREVTVKSEVHNVVVLRELLGSFPWTRHTLAEDCELAWKDITPNADGAS